MNEIQYKNFLTMLRLGRIEIVKDYFEEHKDINLEKILHNETTMTYFIKCSRLYMEKDKVIEMFNLLVQNGAKIYFDNQAIKDSDFYSGKEKSFLLNAIFYGNSVMTDLLWSSANPSSLVDGTLLKYAALSNNIEILNKVFNLLPEKPDSMDDLLFEKFNSLEPYMKSSSPSEILNLFHLYSDKINFKSTENSGLNFLTSLILNLNYGKEEGDMITLIEFLLEKNISPDALWTPNSDVGETTIWSLYGKDRNMYDENLTLLQKVIDKKTLNDMLPKLKIGNKHKL